MEKNVLLTIQYDGSGFSGWQRQPDKRTVQGEIERILGHPIEGCSRTDAGVHAECQKATLRWDSPIPTRNIPKIINDKIPDVAVLKAEEMPEGFHARYDSTGKRYRYKIRCERNIFTRGCEFQYPYSLDFERMKSAAKLFEGSHDFAAFMSQGSTPQESTVRTIFETRLEKDADGLIIFRISGDGFLYNMVRIIVGTLVEIGAGKKNEDTILRAFESGDRNAAGFVAPPQGLCLEEVFYGKRT